MQSLSLKRPISITTSSEFIRALAISQVFALLWWLVGLWLRSQEIVVWGDQVNVFRPSVDHLADPYQIVGFVNPPWVILLIAPFRVLPLELSVLLQGMLYFAILTSVIFKFGGDLRAVALSLSSFVALDATIQMNVDWTVSLGLLLPAALSGPFLLLKPQLALGYYFSLRWRDWFWVGVVSAVVIGVSLLLWGLWPLEIARRVPQTSIGRQLNIAPLNLLPFPLSLLIGVPLAVWAFRERDPALGIVAWLFFVPYVALYSLLLTFSMVAIRWFRLALIIHVSMWVIYGGIIVIGLGRVS